MKEYVRTTHNFSNETREWTYRGAMGQEKHEEWLKAEQDGFNFKSIKLEKWSLGLHILKLDMWMSMDWIVWETIEAYKGDAGGNCQEFEQFLKDNPNHKQIIQQQTEHELEALIKLDMVRVRERQK